VQPALAGEESPEIHPAFLIQRHDLPIENGILHLELGSHTLRELGKPPEHVIPLGADIALPSAEVQDAAKAIEFGFVDPARVMEWGRSGDHDNRLDGGKDLSGSWAYAGSWAACDGLPVALPTRRAAQLAGIVPLPEN
jgi:hypothetical protein